VTDDEWRPLFNELTWEDFSQIARGESAEVLPPPGPGYRWELAMLRGEWHYRKMPVSTKKEATP